MNLPKKKKQLEVVCNGSYPVTIKTMHGQFVFPLQKYLINQENSNYFALTFQFTRDYISPALREFVAYYSNRLSYQQVEDLVERIAGDKILSDQKIWEIVVNKALEISEQWQAEIAEINSLITKEIEISPTVDIYDSKTKEILLFDDGISVKKQKDNRERHQNIISSEPSTLEETETSDQKKSRKKVITDIVLLETPQKTFEYITTPIDADGKPLSSLAESIKAKLKTHYHNYNCPLPIVAITDGAANIRKRLNKLSDNSVTVILDWYHLCKKVREFLSMIARSKSERTDHSQFLFFHLWHGKIDEVLNYLHQEVRARNPQKLSELITYFTKHKSEIINYELRRQSGKTIGSGRMEKGVDLVIGNRQKHKGMSWCSLGSRALAILKVVEFNGQWQQTWFPQAA